MPRGSPDKIRYGPSRSLQWAFHSSDFQVQLFISPTAQYSFLLRSATSFSFLFLYFFPCLRPDLRAGLFKIPNFYPTHRTHNSLLVFSLLFQASLNKTCIKAFVNADLRSQRYFRVHEHHYEFLRATDPYDT
jgi:hypothetical protein